MKVLLIILLIIAVIALVMAFIALIKWPSSVYKNNPDERNPMENKKVVFVENDSEKENADGVRGHLMAIGDSEHKAGAYEKVFTLIINPLAPLGMHCGGGTNNGI